MNYPTAIRWLKFYAVGGIGIGVQLLTLFFLQSVLQMNYLVATVLAVETAVAHNFLWHERFTWADRVRPTWRQSAPRLVRFNLTTGVVSLLGNVLLMELLVGATHINYLVANGIAIAACSLANFVVSDHVVFPAKRGGIPH